ncbi:MAG: helix-turn-helix transcriptional regulator [Oscillospiraceae bacterium]|nr:helix-turn-helix transcriptional regulator [Oscillospiraceae bacterium]
MTFGQKVRKYRLERRLDVSDLSKITGLSESAIKMYEGGFRKTPLPVAKMALASAFKVKPSELDDDREEEKTDA